MAEEIEEKEKQKREGLIDRLPIIPMRKTPVLDRIRGKQGAKAKEGTTLEQRAQELLKKSQKRGTTPRGPEGGPEFYEAPRKRGRKKA